MALNPGVLGPAFIVASGALDPIGIAGWMAIASAFVAWTVSNVIVNPLGGTPMIALGPVITGTGALIPGPTPLLGIALAAASLSTDPAGIAKWMAVSAEYGKWLTSCGVNPSTMVAFVNPVVPTGPVTGVGLVAPVGKPDFATAVGITDPPGKAAWDAIAGALVTQLSVAVVTPTAMLNPGTGGPVTGVGNLS